MEDIRRDVVERRCRVHEREVDGLVSAVQKASQAITVAKGINNRAADIPNCSNLHAYSRLP